MQQVHPPFLLPRARDDLPHEPGVPLRVQTEVVGDGIERIAAVIRAGGSKWVVRLVYASIFLTVLAETVRYWARAIKGGKALR